MVMKVEIDEHSGFCTGVVNAIRKAEQTGGASRYLLRELYASMEQCCREREDFKGAYEYATRQRELSEPK